MGQTAKLFMNGRSQAVRLPRDYRFDCSEVYIRKDPDTGDVIISAKPSSWEEFFRLRDRTDVPDDFMLDRDDQPPQERNLFDD
jgi:antitoxin VapB